MKTLLLIPLIAALAACEKSPPTCDEPSTQKMVAEMFFENANVSLTAFTGDFKSIITHSVSENGEEKCSAKVTFTLSDAAKETWKSASTKLDASVKLSPTAFPVTEYLPTKANSALWFARSGPEAHYSTLMHLAPTKFFTLFAGYMSHMGDPEHPEHLIFSVYETQMNELYSEVLDAKKNYENYINQQMNVEVFYDTKNVKHNGEVKGYVSFKVETKYFDEIQTMNMHHQRAIEILEN
jgi:hypothetical protein